MSTGRSPIMAVEGLRQRASKSSGCLPSPIAYWGRVWQPPGFSPLKAGLEGPFVALAPNCHGGSRVGWGDDDFSSFCEACEPTQRLPSKQNKTVLFNLKKMREEEVESKNPLKGQ